MDLFLKTKNFTKIADIKLISAPENWSQEILAIAKKIYSNLPLENCFIKFTKIDEKQGYGIGELVITSKFQNEKQTQRNVIGSIPIIIKDSHLEPLDIFISKKRIYYLTPERLQKLLFSPELASGVVKKKSSLYTLPSPGDGVSMLGKIGSTISSEDQKKFMEGLDDSSKVKLAKVAGEGLEHITKDNKKSIYEYITKKANASPVHYIVKDKLGNYLIYDKIANHQTLNRKDFNTWLDKNASGVKNEIVEQLNKNKEYYLKNNLWKQADIIPLRQVIKTFDPIKESGFFKLLSKKNQILDAVVLPLYTFKSRRFDEKYIIIDAKTTNYAIQKTVLGKKQRKVEETDLTDQTPAVKDYGCFYFIDKRGAGIAFEPLTISSITLKNESDFEIIGNTLLGEKLRLLPTPGLQNIIKTSDNIYCIPVDTKYIKLGKYIELEIDPSRIKEMQKMAATIHRSLEINYRPREGEENLTPFKIRMQYTKEVGNNRINVDKSYNLDENQLKAFLSNLGFIPEKIPALIQEIQTKNYVTLLDFQVPVSEYMNEKNVEKIIKFIDGLKQNLTKQAAELEDQPTVDNILSLNFINPENINKFVSSIPELEMTETKLGELLIGFRLGLKDIPGGALEQAIRGVAQVTDNLKTLQV